MLTITALLVLLLNASVNSAAGNMAHINPRIIELNDKFVDIYKHDYWFVMFYAPWCGHCKNLDPIWSHVQQSLHNTGIRISRLDCVTYPKACKHFGVGSYPTVMFIKGDEGRFAYHGERTRNELVHFALRVASPPVKYLREDNDKRIVDTDLIFFTYVGDRVGDLWDAFEHVATEFYIHCYFFYAPPEIANKHFREVPKSSVFVKKENKHYIFEHTTDLGDTLNTSLSRWVNRERFPTFMKVSRLNMHIALETKKCLVLAVVEEDKVGRVPQHMLDFRDMVESVIIRNRDRYHRSFQFGWIGSPELGNYIAMTELPLPYLLVVNSSTFQHHIPEDEPAQLTPEAIMIFLDTIVNQSAKVYGGNGIHHNLYRSYFQATVNLSDMWKSNPVLTLVLFGLPLAFLSLICYSTCCADILDANDDDDDDDLQLYNDVRTRKKKQ